MAKTRALLTQTEREQIAGQHDDERRYQATSRARRRVHEELTTDVAILTDHHPDLLAELREVVCATAPTATGTATAESGSESTTVTSAVEDAGTDDGDDANDSDEQGSEQNSEQSGTEQSESNESIGTKNEQNTPEPVYELTTSSRSWKDDRLNGGGTE